MSKHLEQLKMHARGLLDCVEKLEAEMGDKEPDNTGEIGGGKSEGSDDDYPMKSMGMKLAKYK